MTVPSNLKLFQKFCKNPVATETHGRKAELTYGSPLEDGQNQIAYVNLIIFFC